MDIECVEGEEGAEVEATCESANEARDVGKGCLGDAAGDACIGSTISWSFGVAGRG